MARKRPLANSQEAALPEGFEYPPRSPELAPTKAEDGNFHFPINTLVPEGSEEPTAEFLWADAAVEWMQALLQHDAPALQHRLTEVAVAQEEVAQLTTKILETLPEQLPESLRALVAQIQQANSWGTVCLTDAQWRCEALIRGIAPHVEAGTKAKAYRGKLTGAAGGLKSGKSKQKATRSRNAQIYQEFTQARLTCREDIAAKKDALARTHGLKSRKQIDRIIKAESKRTSREP